MSIKIFAFSGACLGLVGRLVPLANLAREAAISSKELEESALTNPRALNRNLSQEEPAPVPVKLLGERVPSGTTQTVIFNRNQEPRFRRQKPF